MECGDGHVLDDSQELSNFLRSRPNDEFTIQCRKYGGLEVDVCSTKGWILVPLRSWLNGMVDETPFQGRVNNIDPLTGTKQSSRIDWRTTVTRIVSVARLSRLINNEGGEKFNRRVFTDIRRRSSPLTGSSRDRVRIAA